MEVHTLPDGRYHAGVSYLDEENNTMQFTFEGTRQEIREQIRTNTTLPDDKKQALLEALHLDPGMSFRVPTLGDNPFHDPFFQ